MSGGGTTSATTTQNLSPQQQQLLSGVTPIASAYAANPPQAYQGTTTAPISPYTYQGESQALGAAAGPIQSQTQQALAGSQWLTSGQALDAQSNPYLQSAINAAVLPISQNYQRTVLPGINDAAIQSGQFGYNRQALETNQAMQDYLQSVGSTAANMASTGYQQGLGAMTSALGTAPGVAAAGALPGEITGAVGTQQQQLEQQSIDAAMQQYYTEQFMPLTVAQQIASMAFGMPGGSTVSQQQVPGVNPLQALMGLGSTAGGVMSGLGALGVLA